MDATLDQLLDPGNLIPPDPLVPVLPLVQAGPLVPADPPPAVRCLVPALGPIPALLPATKAAALAGI